MANATASVAKQNLLPEKAVVPALAFLALLGGNAALAAGPLFVRLADVGPVAAAFWRLTIALPVLALLAWRQGNGAAGWRPAGTAAALAACGGLFFAADLASWHVGILQTKLANATLFGNTASLILAATTLLLARRLPRWSEASAVLLACIGALLLLRESSGAGQARLIGDMLCLLAGTLYAGYMLSLQRARRTLANWPALAISTAAGTLPLLAMAALMGETVLPTHWAPVILLAVSSQLVGQGLLIYALPHFSALVVGLTLLTQPAVAAVIGWIAYREQLTLMDAIGAVLLGLALVLVRLPARPVPPQARGHSPEQGRSDRPL